MEQSSFNPYAEENITPDIVAELQAELDNLERRREYIQEWLDSLKANNE